MFCGKINQIPTLTQTVDLAARIAHDQSMIRNILQENSPGSNKGILANVCWCIASGLAASNTAWLKPVPTFHLKTWVNGTGQDDRRATKDSIFKVDSFEHRNVILDYEIVAHKHALDDKNLFSQ